MKVMKGRMLHPSVLQAWHAAMDWWWGINIPGSLTTVVHELSFSTPLAHKCIVLSRPICRGQRS